MLKEAQIEGYKHQNHSDIYYQSFPEMVPEDQGIHSDDYGDHHYHIKDGDYRSCHCDVSAIWSFRSLDQESSIDADVRAASSNRFRLRNAKPI